MRFHMGVSFSWRTLKKFIIPILLGALAYFGFSGIFDNFDFPLGFMRLIRVNALENYDTTYNLEYTDYSNLLDNKIDDNLTYNEFLNLLIDSKSDYYDFVITLNPYASYNIYYLDTINILLLDKTSSIPINIYGRSSFLYQSFYSSNNYIPVIIYTFSFTNGDILSSGTYSDFSNCYLNNSNCSSKRTLSLHAFRCPVSSNNTDDNSCFSVPTNSNSSNFEYGFIYYSSKPLYLSAYSSYVNNSNYFFKTLVLNDKTYSNGDYFPTYYEYMQSLLPDEDNPPIEDETNHKKLFSKIFWLDDSNTEKGILSSIYILLFLYCLTMILFKIATLLKNKRW